MTSVVNPNRFFQYLYPTTIFLFTALAWNTAGHEGVRVDLGFPKLEGPTWRAPASSAAFCGSDHLAFLKENSCQAEKKEGKLFDKNEQNSKSLDVQNMQLSVRALTNQTRSSIQTTYQ